MFCPNGQDLWGNKNGWNSKDIVPEFIQSKGVFDNDLV